MKTTIEIDLKYMIPIVGVYNKAVYECPECGCENLDGFYNHIIGFSHSSIGLMKISECPNCHTKYYSHASKGDYSHFLWYAERNTNIHFKKEDE